MFPLLGLSVPPEAGSALFWYNLDTGGRGHMETIHAGCPVLLGHKDITNYWFWYQGQERHRPCLREEQVRNV